MNRGRSYGDSILAMMKNNYGQDEQSWVMVVEEIRTGASETGSHRLL
ncbi:hypothetical protein GA0004734_00046500 [Rhizobium sp. 9140]|nr:hypothetical protein GA0004734_00046500 [Rhizobium sp. 9140]